MPESINAIAIKLGVDASGVEEGMSSAAATLRMSRSEIERAERVEREHNINEMLKAEEEANKRRIKAEQDFQKWYATQMDMEVAEYIAAEEAKTAALQRAEAERRQMLIYTHNMQQINPFQTFQQDQVSEWSRMLEEDLRKRQAIVNEEMALSNRQQQIYLHNLQNLEDAITREERLRSEANAKLAADIQQRANAITAANSASLVQDQVDARNRLELARVTSQQEDAQREQDMINLRNDIQQRASLRQREIDQERTTRSIINTIRTQQANELARQNNVRQQNNRDIAEAKRITDSLMNTHERYEAGLANLNRLLHVYNMETGQAVLTTEQYEMAVDRLRMANQQDAHIQAFRNRQMQQTADAGRVMTGVLAQASFAAEDFIQGMVFGDVRTALLGASNNLTMVARGLIQVGKNAQMTNGAMALLVGKFVLLPAAVIGLGSYLLWLNRAKSDTRELSDILSQLRKEWETFNALTAVNRSARNTALDIASIQTYDEATSELNGLLREQDGLSSKLANTRNEESRNLQAIFERTLGGQEAILELQRQIDKTIWFGTPDEVAAATEMRDLLNEANAAALNADYTTMINSLREINNLLEAGELRNWTEFVDDLVAHDNLQTLFNTGILGTMSGLIQGAGDDLEALKKLQEEINAAAKDRTVQEAEQAALADNILKAKIKQLQLAEKEAEAARLAANARKTEILDSMRLTDLQKELLAIREQQAGLFSPDVFMGGAAGALQFAADQAANMQFLLLQKQKLEKDLLDMQPEITVKGGLMQNAFDAQAKAFEQMFQAPQKPNPQIERTNQLLQAIENVLKNGGNIRVVP